MERKILMNLHLLDGISPEPLEDHVLIIENDLICWAGPRVDWEQMAQANQKIFDLKGVFILPGLWDMHLHLDFRLSDKNHSATDDALFAHRRALTLLNSGVTSLRVPGTAQGADFALRAGINNGEYVGPRIITSGPGLVSTGGHGAPGGKGYDGPYEFRRAARETLFRGADFVKIMVTGGIIGQNEALEAPQMLRDEVATVVEIAHNWGKHVSGHIASAPAAIMCAQLGVDTIEHGYTIDKKALEVMRDYGASYVPTFTVTNSPQYWEGVGMPQWAVAKIRQASVTHRKAVEMALDLGLTITFGSDTPTPFVDGAIGVVREMEAFADLGVKPREIVSWATKVPSKICGIASEVGTLQEGKMADLIATPNNPYESISHLREVCFVMTSGRIIRDDVTDGEKPGLLGGCLES